MIKLTADDIILLHEKIIDKTGGIRGIRDIGLNIILKNIMRHSRS